MCYKSLLRNGAVIIAATLLTLAACKRKDTTDNTAPALTTADDKGGYASDNAQLERTSNDVISLADVAGTTGSVNMRTTSSCATVHLDTTVTPHILTINFGTSDCLCSDLRKRRGEIIVTFSGHYKDSGSTHNITYDNYFIDDVQVTGHKSVTNEGTNSSGQVWYSVNLSDSLILGADSIISWTATRTRTWLDGYSTPDRSDDVYAIAGTTTLTRANGHSFTMNITTPLQVAQACTWMEAGVVHISSSTFAGGDRVLDYGAGTCDDLATLTIGTHTYDITLH